MCSHHGDPPFQRPLGPVLTPFPSVHSPETHFLPRASSRTSLCSLDLSPAFFLPFKTPQITILFNSPYPPPTAGPPPCTLSSLFRPLSQGFPCSGSHLGRSEVHGSFHSCSSYPSNSRQGILEVAGPQLPVLFVIFLNHSSPRPPATGPLGLQHTHTRASLASSVPASTSCSLHSQHPSASCLCSYSHHPPSLLHLWTPHVSCKCLAQMSLL